MSGLDAEKELQSILERCGWFCIRSVGSRGPVDVAALKKNLELLIQVKQAKGDQLYAGYAIKMLDRAIKDLNLKSQGLIAVNFPRLKKWLLCDTEKMSSNGVMKISANQENRFCSELRECSDIDAGEDGTHEQTRKKQPSLMDLYNQPNFG